MSQHIFLTGTGNQLDVNLSRNIEGHYFRIKSMILPYIWYNMKTSKQLLITLEDGSINYITFRAGNYNSTNIISTMEEKLSVIGNFTISIDEIDFKLSINCDQNFKIGGDFAEFIGFSENQIHNMDLQMEHKANNILDLSGTKYIYVVGVGINGASITNDINSNRNIIAQIPVNVNFGEVVYYRSTTEDYIPVSGNSEINYFTLYLMDEEYNILPIDDNIKWSIIIDVIRK